MSAKKKTLLQGQPNPAGTNAGKDALGSRLGSQAAAINAVLGKKPKTEAEIMQDTGLSQARVRAHLRWIVTKGHGTKGESGFQLTQ